MHDEQTHILGLSAQYRDWVRYPGLAERQKKDTSFCGMAEMLYQQLYACHLCLAVARLREAFVDQNPELAQQEVILARVPRGGVFSTELLESLLEEFHPRSLNLHKEQISALRRAKKQLQLDQSSAELRSQYLRVAAQLVEAATIPLSGKELHLLIPEDIADSGNTLLLIIEAYFRKVVAAGHSALRVSLLVPTASIDSLHDQTGILARARYLESVLSEEFGHACSLRVQLFTLYEEEDAEYLAELRHDKHDHGTTHEAVRNHPVFPELKRRVVELFPAQGEFTEASQGVLLQELLSVIQTEVAVA